MNIAENHSASISKLLPSGGLIPRSRIWIQPQTPGTVQLRRLPRPPLREYYLYVPTRILSGSRLLVAAHGISRNAYEHASRLAPFAESHGRVLVAPLFPQKSGGYQRLGLCGAGPRTDRILDEILAEVEDLTGVNGDRFDLSGFSAGAQFAHRYTMAHPERVLHLAIAAAGWYTFPNPNLDYPLGIRSIPELGEVPFLPERFLGVPTRVFVGDRDTRGGRSLRSSRRLNRLQGRTRIERARRWVAAMNEAATKLALEAHYELELLPNSGHSFRESMCLGGLGQKVFEFVGSAPTNC